MPVAESGRRPNQTRAVSERGDGNAKVVADVLGILRKEYETVFGRNETDGESESECGSPRPVETWCHAQSERNRADVASLDTERARLEGALRAEERVLGEMQRSVRAEECRATTLARERSELRGMLVELAHGVCAVLLHGTGAP